MTPRQNELGQPIGFPLDDWQPARRPPHVPLVGEYCTVAPLDVEQHARSLFEAHHEAADDRHWTYLGYGPFRRFADYEAWLREECLGGDPQFYVVIDHPSGRALGVASYLRIEPAQGVIEVGHLNFAPRMQKTRMSTEAMYLMMKNVFDLLGYRRYEWKCDNLNEPSKRAAARLGFRPEGVFRQAAMYKGRNRDSAWFSILDHEWPNQKRAFEAWLAASNFGPDGQQKQKLGDGLSST